jgi:DNA-binding NarL/FixJ family response regulator
LIRHADIPAIQAAVGDWDLIRILLVDDHTLVRQALRVLIESQSDMTVVAESADAADAEATTVELDPDLVVVDMLMPGPGGIELTRRLKRRQIRARIVVVTVHATEAAAHEALHAGAEAFVPKTAEAAEFFHAIRQAALGRRYLGPPFSPAAIERILRSREAGLPDPYETLTSREREVLQLAAQGLSSPAIAKKLFISPRTAETHRARVMRKLAIRNQTELIFFALRHGLLWIEPTRSQDAPERTAAAADDPEGQTPRRPPRPARETVRR